MKRVTGDQKFLSIAPVDSIHIQFLVIGGERLNQWPKQSEKDRHVLATVAILVFQPFETELKEAEYQDKIASITVKYTDLIQWINHFFVMSGSSSY